MRRFNIQLEKRQYKALTLLLAISLVLAIIFGYNTNAEKTQYQTFLQNNYQRAFRDLVKNVENINVLLTKAEITNSAVQSNDLMSQVWRQSNSAAENMGQLPVTHNTLTNTEKYLTQVGDYCYTLSRQNAANKLIDDKQAAQIAKLQSYSQNCWESCVRCSKLPPWEKFSLMKREKANN